MKKMRRLNIQTLISEVDIVDVISEYLNLERVGSNYRTNCPFHPDSNPSFYVSPEKQIFKCFGCGVGGNVIKFIQLYEGVSFEEAVRILAEKYGLEVKVSERKELQALHRVYEFYRNSLKSEEKAIRYLKGRGLNTGLIRKFGIGFSPKNADFKKLLGNLLPVYLSTKNLIKQGDRLVDIFRNRVIFPVRNQRGEVLGFVGRSIDGSEPKYINSPDSEIFRKSELLFGLYENLKLIRDRNYVVLVEGVFDVILLHGELIPAVASLGTAFTYKQGELLSRYTDTVIVMYDSDSAGRRGAEKAIKVLLSHSINVKVATLPEGEDPASYIQKGKDIKNVLENSEEIFNLLLRETEKEEGIKKFLEFLSYVGDTLYVINRLRLLSRKTGIPLSTLSRHLELKKKERKDMQNLTAMEKFFLSGLSLYGNFKEEELEKLQLSDTAKELALRIIRNREKIIFYEISEREYKTVIKHLTELKNQVFVL